MADYHLKITYALFRQKSAVHTVLFAFRVRTCCRYVRRHHSHHNIRAAAACVEDIASKVNWANNEPRAMA